MFAVTDARIVLISFEKNVAFLRACHNAPINGEPYYFVAKTEDAATMDWWRGLTVGDVIPLEGLPFPAWNEVTRQWELAIQIGGAVQPELTDA